MLTQILSSFFHPDFRHSTDKTSKLCTRCIFIAQFRIVSESLARLAIECVVSLVEEVAVSPCSKAKNLRATLELVSLLDYRLRYCQLPFRADLCWTNRTFLMVRAVVISGFRLRSYRREASSWLEPRAFVHEFLEPLREGRFSL